VNPISRAGISEAMKSGTLAGDYAMRMLKTSARKEMKKICDLYEKAWHKKLGKRHFKLAKVKNSLLKVPDADYNAGAQALSGIQQDQLTMSKIFTLSLGKFPKLVWALRHLM
jgi:digeranylgeranylglycerophospholipid reductase